MTTPGKVLRALAAGLLMCVLASCGSQAPGNDSPAAPESTQASSGGDLLPPAEGKTQYPLTLESPWGTSELKQRPTRVVALGWYHDAEYMASMGATPVMVFPRVLEEEWMKDAFPHPVEATVKDAEGAYTMEEIAKLKPDLILFTSANLSDNYDKLKTIAPVVTTSTDDPDVKGPWQDRMRAVAKALDLSDAAEAALKKYDEDFVALRAQYPQFAGKTVNATEYFGAQDGLAMTNTEGTTAESLFDAMGFAQSPLRSAVPDTYLSNEQLGELDADLLLTIDSTYNAEAGTSDISQLTDLPLYQNLNVVKNGHAITIAETGTSYIHQGTEHPGILSWGINTSGPIGQLWAAKVLAPIFAEPLGG